MKKYFSTEALFVFMLLISFNSILLAQNIFKTDSKFVKIDVPRMYNEVAFLRGNDNTMKIELPVLGGVKMEFIIKENNTISGDFKKEYPEIKSFDIESTSNPNYRGALTITKTSLYASILTEKGLLGIWPTETGVRNEYKVYLGDNDPEVVHKHLECGDNELSTELIRENQNIKIESRSSGQNGDKLRIYKLVIVSTGEFYEANGGTISKVNSLIVAIVNGWNVILKNDIGVRLNLAQSPYIYTNKNTDPFIPNGSGGASRTTQAVDAIHAKFNKNSYHIGHVLHNHSSQLDPNVLWDNGGLAGLGVVCNNNTYFGTTGGPNKAGGWSGAYYNNYNGFIQLSVHEVGHQFNMTHTFNGSGESCDAAISDNTAYEIGSGTTIMSYNSICSADQNIPEGGVVDNYYHSNSIDRAVNFIRNVATCGSVSNSGNTPPSVDVGSNYIIPKNTPFVLTGNATDDDAGDVITYCWEQYDEDGPGSSTQGAIGASAASNRKAPLFRSYPPTEEPSRYFPNMKYILEGNNRNLPFEALPSVNRTMNFRLLVRDNHPSCGGVAWDEVSVTVDSKASLFQVSSQNSTTTINADGTSVFNVTWNVGGTDKAPINCSEVEIYFSEDGGKSFPYLLATTANDGNEEIIVPNLPTILGRVMVKAKGNIFFDVNNKDIIVTSTCGAIGTSFVPDVDVVGDDDGEIDEKLDLNLAPVYGKLITRFVGSIRSNDTASKLVFKNNNSCATAGNDVKYDLYEFYVTKTGDYKFKYSGVSGLIMNIYKDEYLDNDKCFNWMNSSGVSSGNNVTLSDRISVNLKAGQKYVLRMSSFSSSTPGLPANYNISILTKPSGALMYDNIIPPGNDYTYTFLAYNNATKEIGAINSESDFRYLNSGSYTVIGASVANSDTTLFNNYVGQTFDILLSDVIASNLCASFSHNTIQIKVFGSNCPIGDEGLTDLLCNDNGTNTLPEDDFITFTLNPVGYTDTIIYKLVVPDGLTIIPDSAYFGTPTDYILQGVKGESDISIELTYGEDCRYSFTLENPGTCSDCVNAEARINEFHYDNILADEGEFVEVYIINPQPDSLSHYRVTLYNGSNGKEYAHESLDNMEVTVGNNGSFYVWSPSSIQNGAPDGISLKGECNVLEFLSYEGSFTAIDGDAIGMTSVDIGAFEPKNTPKGGSLQFIEGVWVQTVSFNTIGAVNDLGPCIVAAVDIKNLTCFDNGTSSNPTDDIITFELNPIGNQLDGEYTITSNKGSISPSQASFDSLTLFTVLNSNAGNGDIDITITNFSNTDCSNTFTLSDPGTCSPDCIINTSGLNDVACNNNETTGFAGDDYITFSLNPTSFNNSSQFNLQSSGGVVSPNSGDFGSVSTFSLWAGSAGGGNVVVSIVDEGIDTCTFDIQIIDPGVCSTSAVESIDGKEKQISLYPNPVGDDLYCKTDLKNINKVKIIDNLGKVILTKVFKERINISKLVKGSYFILFFNEKGILIETNKFLKH